MWLVCGLVTICFHMIQDSNSVYSGVKELPGQIQLRPSSPWSQTECPCTCQSGSSCRYAMSWHCQRPAERKKETKRKRKGWSGFEERGEKSDDCRVSRETKHALTKQSENRTPCCVSDSSADYRARSALSHLNTSGSNLAGTHQTSKQAPRWSVAPLKDLRPQEHKSLRCFLYKRKMSQFLPLTLLKLCQTRSVTAATCCCYSLTDIVLQLSVIASLTVTITSDCCSVVYYWYYWSYIPLYCHCLFSVITAPLFSLTPTPTAFSPFLTDDFPPLIENREPLVKGLEITLLWFDAVQIRLIWFDQISTTAANRYWYKTTSGSYLTPKILHLSHT